MKKITKIINSLKNYCKLWDRDNTGDNDLAHGIKTILTELERLQKENKRLSAEFTCKSPLEMIRAKCEQYWNEPFTICPEEMHVILEFIHQLTRTAEKQCVT